MMTASHQHNRDVDHVCRPGLPAKCSRGPGPGVAQWLHKDVTSVQEPSQSCLAPTAPTDRIFHWEGNLWAVARVGAPHHRKGCKVIVTREKP
jgi:hypothetical protein